MTALTVPTDVELEELARTLETADIPSKLRCGVCDLLAFDTMRLPCCSTNICDKCYDNELGEECIICCHKPLEKTLCEPNKPMRITIKAFLKRKFNDRAKKQKEAVKAQPVEQIKEKPEAIKNNIQESKPVPAETNGEITRPNEDIHAVVTPIEPSTVQIQTNDAQIAGEVEDRSQNEIPSSPMDDDSEVEIITERAPDKSLGDTASHSNFDHQNHTNPMNAMNGINGMNQMNGINGMLPMDFASMLAAANGMMPMAGLSNMMGMGMMPAMSQMFAGFDSNMGMNGMNMGGMDGYQGQNQYGGNGNESWMNNNQGNFDNSAYGDGNFGAFAGYNMSAQPNNYNQMNEQAYANNDFYRGYGRQGSANRRGRRGYYNGGGFGRGSYNQGNNQYSNSNQDHLYPQRGDRIASGKSELDENKTTTTGVPSHDAALQASFAPGGEHDFDEELGRNGMAVVQPTSAQSPTGNASESTKDTEPTRASEHATNESRHDLGAHTLDGPTKLEKPVSAPVSNDTDSKHGALRPIQAFVSDEPLSITPKSLSTFNGPVSQETSRVPFIPGPISVTSTTELRGVGVAGAPTGPRALRVGLPNTGRSSFRYGQASKPAIASPVVSEPPQNHRSAEIKNNTLKGSRRVESSSPERNPSASHHGQYQDSQSPIKEFEQNGHTEKHHERSRKYPEDHTDYDDKRPSKSSRRKHGDYVETEDDSRRSKHRSRRHKDEDTDTDTREQRSTKRSHRDREEHDEDHHRHSSKRSRHHHEEDASSSSRKHRRDRSRSLDHRSSDKDKHSHRKSHQQDHNDRKRSRDDAEARQSSNHEVKSTEVYPGRRPSRHEASAAEGESSYHDSKRSRHDHAAVSHRGSMRDSSSKPSTPITTTFTASQPAHRTSDEPSRGATMKQIPTGPRSTLPTSGPVKALTTRPVAPQNSTTKDPHTLEREARDRERLQREMQRRAFVDVKNSGTGMGRKAVANGNSSSANSRRLTYRYEEEGGLDVRRGEREREGGRW